MKAFLSAAVLVIGLGCGAELFAQKVILEGGEGSSVKAQMELYSRWTKDEVLKAQYASFAEREPLSKFSNAQFKAIYEHQLKEMYRVVGGELIQVKEWQIKAIAQTIAPRAKLVEMNSAKAKVPQLCRVQVKKFLGKGVYAANVSSLNGAAIASIVQFATEGDEYAAGTVLEAYLVQKKLAAEVASLTRGFIYAYTYECVADEIGQSVHEPTMKEMATAIKKGLKPLVMVPMGTRKCATCEGAGVDEAKIASADAAAKQGNNRLGKREVMYDGLGRREASRNKLGDSKNFEAAKLKMKKPPCEVCEGDGKVPFEIFRLLTK